MLRIYLNEACKADLLTKEEELALTRNLQERQKAIYDMVFNSEIMIEELNKWNEMIDAGEMTIKELLPRGKQSKKTLEKELKKFKDTLKFINKTHKEIMRLKLKLQEKIK
jgi:hypothetical protein